MFDAKQTAFMGSVVDSEWGSLPVYWCPGAAETICHWLSKTTRIYSLTGLEARSPALRCQRGCALSEGSVESFFLASSLWGFLILLGLWPHHFNLCLGLHMAFSLCVFLLFFCFLLGHLSLDLVPTCVIQDEFFLGSFT